MDARRELLDGRALLRRFLRTVGGLHRHEHDFLVQHLVVLEIVQQRRRHVILVAGQEDREARNADDAARLRQAGEERRDRHAVLPPARQQQIAPAFP